MATVNTTWTSPASATLDKATGATIDETMMDALASNLYSIGGTAGYIGCRAFMVVTQSIADSTATALTLGSENLDTDPNGAMHDLVTNSSRVTIRTTGLYLLAGHITFSPHATGYRTGQFRVNGAGVLATDARTSIGGASNHDQMFSHVYPLTASDYIELLALQTSGVANTILGGVLMVVKL